MKRVAILAVGALVALGLMPATAGAGVAATGQVTIVHDATYDATTEPNVPVTVCLDGDPVAGIDEPFVWGDILGPLTLPVGTYDVAVYLGEVPFCNGKTTIADELTVDPGADITVAAIWPSTGPELAVWPNDNSCVEPDTARVTVRHGAATEGPVDVLAAVDGEVISVVEALEEGAQAITDIPAPLVTTGLAVVFAGTDEVVIEVGDTTFEPGINYVVYAGGGADGDAGVFVDPIPLTPCAVPVTTPTTEPAPAAEAVAARPAFTG